MPQSHTHNLSKIAQQIRHNIIQMLVPMESHHIGCSLGIVEILTTLYFDVLSVNPAKPNWDKRDIFILSKGHAGAALYATLATRGFFSPDILKKYDTNGGILPEHASRVVPGIELSTGSLGHGLPVGLGFALDFKRKKMDNRVFVLMSDGELDEGSNWEAFLFGAHHKLDNVIAIIDYNKFQGFGNTNEVLNLEPIDKKLHAFGWNTHEVDGHDTAQLSKILHVAWSNKTTKPTAIIAHTIKGKGIPFFEGKFVSHYHSISQVTKDEILQQFK